MPRAKVLKRQFKPRPIDTLARFQCRLDRPVFNAMHRLIQRCKYDLGMISFNEFKRGSQFRSSR